jgi:DNA-binding response OmpR family regulator
MAQRSSRPVFLFVEPSLARHRRLRVALRRRGAHVLMAPSAEEGLDRGELFPPDAIVVADGLRNTEGDSYAEIFRAAFPRARMLPDDATLASEIAREYPLLTPLGPKTEGARVVCVDDDPLYLKSLVRHLERYGYRVKGFDNPDRALRAIGAVPPDLVLADVRMADMDGIELTRRIRESTRGRVPVVLLTAVPLEEARAWGRGAGAICFLSKQAVPDQVLDVIDSLIGDVDDDERAFLKIPG